MGICCFSTPTEIFTKETIYNEHTTNFLGTIDDNLGTIDDVDDDAGLTTVRSVCDQAETTGLNETLKHVFK